MNVILFARNHLRRLNLLDSGLPKDLDKKWINLSENINYYWNSHYASYPEENITDLSLKMIAFLKKIEALKGFDARELNFLTDKHFRFQSCAETINILIQVFCEPNKDFICIFSPTFPLYQYCAANNNILVKDLHLSGSNYQFINVDEVFSIKPKILFIPYPNNPVGSVLDEANLRKLLSYSEGMIVIDEAYIEFSKAASLIKYIQERDNLIILRSFSKSLGLAGIRTGVLIASPQVINIINSFCVPRSFPQHTQDILHKILKKHRKIKRVIRKVVKQREVFADFLKNLHLISKVYESQTNFVSAQFKNSHAVNTHLMQDQFFIKDCNALCENMLRISIGTPQQMRHLRKSFKKLETSQRKKL